MSNCNSMVAHLWANQSKPSAQSSNGNFWFRDRTIYSYRTPIAHLMPCGAVLRTSETFSVTTSGKHETAISQALRYGAAIHVPVVNPLGAGDHGRNVESFRTRIAGLLGKASRARSNAGWLLESAAKLIAEANRYLDVFALEDARFALYDNHAGIIDAARTEAVRRQQAAIAARLAEEAARVPAWIAGEDVRAPRTAGVLLRVKPSDPATLETSLGAEVPLAHAIRIVKFAKRARDEGAEFIPLPGERPAVGHFRVDALRADGTIIAGCHTIPWAESARLAAALGVF